MLRSWSGCSELSTALPLPSNRWASGRIAQQATTLLEFPLLAFDERSESLALSVVGAHHVRVAGAGRWCQGVLDHHV